jgi:hypothetical protein
MAITITFASRGIGENLKNCIKKFEVVIRFRWIHGLV